MVALRLPSKKKVSFVERIKDLFDEYQKCILFNADNVSSTQLQSVKKQLRGKAEIVMGKNTLFKKALFCQFEKYPSLQRLYGQFTGNIGILFTNEPTLGECRSILETPSEPQPAKAGTLAQCDVIISKGVTTVTPEKTSFFQSLNISTMINKGFVEIMSDVFLIKTGAKVGESETTLLGMLGIKPFNYRLKSKTVYDEGAVYSPAVLDITSKDWEDGLHEAVSSLAMLSLGAGLFNRASACYELAYHFKTIVGSCLEIEYDTERAVAVKNALETATSAPVVAQAATASLTDAPQDKQEEEEEESDGDLGLSLFD